jgi:hypothetical protein
MNQEKMTKSGPESTGPGCCDPSGKSDQTNGGLPDYAAMMRKMNSMCGDRIDCLEMMTRMKGEFDGMEQAASGCCPHRPESETC